MRLAITITIVIIVFYISCGVVNSWDVNRYKNNFNTQRKQYDELVEGLKKCNLRVGYTVYTNELPDDLQSLLEELEITRVSFKLTTCDGKTDYQFESNWSAKTHLFYTYSTCEVRSKCIGLSRCNVRDDRTLGPGEWLGYDD